MGLPAARIKQLRAIILKSKYQLTNLHKALKWPRHIQEPDLRDSVDYAAARRNMARLLRASRQEQRYPNPKNRSKIPFQFRSDFKQHGKASELRAPRDVYEYDIHSPTLEQHYRSQPDPKLDAVPYGFRTIGRGITEPVPPMAALKNNILLDKMGERRNRRIARRDWLRSKRKTK